MSPPPPPLNERLLASSTIVEIKDNKQEGNLYLLSNEKEKSNCSSFERMRSSSSPNPFAINAQDLFINDEVERAEMELNASTTMSMDSVRAYTDPLPHGAAEGTSSTIISLNDDTKQRSYSAVSFVDTLDIFRESAKTSKNPKLQMDFALYLLDSAKKALEAPELLAVSAAPASCEDLDMDMDLNNRKFQLFKLQETMRREGLEWLKKLSIKPAGQRRQPLAEAQYLLAEAYGKGLYGLKVEHSKAFLFYLLASKQNHSESSFKVAVCYEYGAGTKKDNNRAVLFYRKAASLGDKMAIHKLALILLFGKLGQKRNMKEGMTWLKIAASNANSEHPEALHDLAQCYEKEGGCPVILSDEQYALHLYNTAANYGFAPSQYRLGMCFEFGQLNCEIDAYESIKWYVKAAGQGMAAAELALSSWYKNGAEDHNGNQIIQQDEDTCFQWALRAANREYFPAFFTIGYYFEVGIGVTRDLEEAKIWYEKASNGGSKRAIARLKEIKRRERIERKCRIT